MNPNNVAIMMVLVLDNQENESCFLVFEGRIKISKTQDDMQVRGLANSDANPLRSCWCVIIHHQFC